MEPPANIPYLRTPSSRFDDLPDFPYTPHYLQYGCLRMAYIDETSTPSASSTSAPETFLCLHGQPTWSYLYRHMLPVLLHHTTHPSGRPQTARRVLAPDLLGFGRSDKPAADAAYTFGLHRASLLHFVRTLDLRNITLVVQDWGGLLGLTLPVDEPARFTRLLVMNTTIAVGAPPTKGFVAWRAFSNRSPDMQIGRLMGRSVARLSEKERAAYDAPFPSAEFKGGVRRFPNLVMVEEGMDGVGVSREALRYYASADAFGPSNVFVACGMKDPVLGPEVMEPLSKVFKNGCMYAEIPDAGHFVQEWGAEVARLAIACFENKGPVQGVRRVRGADARL